MKNINVQIVIYDEKIIPDCYWDVSFDDIDMNTIADNLIKKIKDFVVPRPTITEKDIKRLEQCIVNSMCNLDVNYLSELKDEYMYSYSFKDEIIIEFANLFKKLLLKGVTKLIMKPSKCKYCYPELNTFSFYNPTTDEFIIRYVVGKSEKYTNEFILEECRNILRTREKNELPF